MLNTYFMHNYKNIFFINHTSFPVFFVFLHSVPYRRSVPTMKIKDLSHLFICNNLHNLWLPKTFFAPLYCMCKILQSSLTSSGFPRFFHGLLACFVCPPIHLAKVSRSQRKVRWGNYPTQSVHSLPCEMNPQERQHGPRTFTSTWFYTLS